MLQQIQLLISMCIEKKPTHCRKQKALQGCKVWKWKTPCCFMKHLTIFITFITVASNSPKCGPRPCKKYRKAWPQNAEGCSTVLASTSLAFNSMHPKPRAQLLGWMLNLKQESLKDTWSHPYQMKTKDVPEFPLLSAVQAFELQGFSMGDGSQRLQPKRITVVMGQWLDQMILEVQP